MDIQKSGNIGTEQARTRSQQQAVERKPEQGEQQKAAQGTKIPTGANSGQENAAASVGKETKGAPRQQADASAQAAAASPTTAQTSASATTTSEDDAAYQAIVQKADNGQTLTSSELSQLRTKDPARYNRAVKAMEARQNLRSQMESDPNHASRAAKEAVDAVRAQAQQDSAAVSGAHGTMDSAAPIVRALNDEYNSFARQYDQVLFEASAAAEDE